MTSASGNGLVFVIDDDVGILRALASLIESVGLHVECFSSPEEFLCRHDTDTPSCLVLDVRLPDYSGLDLQRKLAGKHRQIPIIFITAHGDIDMAVRAMKAGAIEFLVKPFNHQTLLDAICQALDRDRAAEAHGAQLAGVQSRVTRLTQRQRQILGRIVEGRLNKQIAAELELSENTIKVHRRHIMEKMKAANVAELVHLVELIGGNRGLRQSN